MSKKILLFTGLALTALVIIIVIIFNRSPHTPQNLKQAAEQNIEQIMKENNEQDAAETTPLTIEEIASFTAISPTDAVKQMTPGWNLGNTLDATPTESSWGNKASERNFDDIKAAGFRSVRIPVTWDSHIGPAPDYAIDSGWMNRVEEVVDWALDRDLYVMLNSHHDSWSWMNLDKSDDPEAALLKFEKVWKQIAVRFKDKSAKLMLEILNEPTDMKPEQMNEIDERILKVIRESGGFNEERLVVVAGLWNDSQQALDHFKAPADEHIILTVHYYSPWDFLNNWWGRTTWGSEGDKKEVDDLFLKLHDQFIANGLPIIIGEYATTMRIDRLSKYYYYDHIAGAAEKWGMAMILWDNGENLNRVSGQWRDQTSKDILVNAANGISNSFVSPADIYIHENAKPSDIKIQLQLNGNKLLSIRNGNDQLVENADFVLDYEASSITIDKQYVTSLLNEGTLGYNAALTFVFSAGAEQELQINRVAAPVMEGSSLLLADIGAVQLDMRIPIQFNGTKLAAVQAWDVAKKEPVAEPDRLFLRMYDHFDYDSNTLILKKSFLNTIKTDTVIKLQFWPNDLTVEFVIKVQEEEIAHAN